MFLTLSILGLLLVAVTMGLSLAHALGFIPLAGADELAGREENITFSMPKELRVRSLL